MHFLLALDQSSDFVWNFRLIMTLKDLPGSPVIKNLPSNAGDMVLIPGWGTKIPCALEQLNPHTTHREPVCHNWRSLRAATAEPAHMEARAPQPGSPETTARESLHVTMKNLHTHKK